MEDLFREKLSDAEVTPGDGFRQSLFRRVALKEYFRFNLSRFNIYYTAAAAVIITASVILLTEREPLQSAGRNDLSQENKTNADSVTLYYSNPVSKTEPEQNKVKYPDTRMQGEGKKDKGKYGSEPEIQDKQTYTDTISKMDPAANFADVRAAGKVRTNPSASFRLPVTEGCAPLKIKIRNTSAPFDSCIWSFGDGGTSRETDPEWIFETPGIYRVTLKVFSNSGLSSSFTGQVSVYSRPEARFEVVATEDGSDYFPVRFVNYSAGAVRFMWNFGDGSSSQAVEPVHRYEKQGKYTVKLTAWSEKGCESIAEAVYTVDSRKYYIKFPNAFIPNPTGPAGGYYSATSDAAAQIFHPESSGVAEYRLRIYTRTGLLLFESNDINIGWDGYHKGSLCEPGVYLWKATGKFRNGETFSKSGDITLVRSNN